MSLAKLPEEFAGLQRMLDNGFDPHAYVRGVLARNRAAEAEARETRIRQLDDYHRLKATRKPAKWDDAGTEWEPELYVKASSWNAKRLFPAVPVQGVPDDPMDPSRVVRCPGEGRQFCYVNSELPESVSLAVDVTPEKSGRVFFDSAVVMPVLYERHADGRQTTWMGLTPMEILTQRPGVALARGRVVVGGLGLGWFLDQVCRKPGVTEVVVVDVEPRLIDWLRPAIEAAYPAVAAKVTAWVADDVYVHMLDEHDRWGDTTYLLDIWPTYGAADKTFDVFKARLGPRLWGWGQDLGDATLGDLGRRLVAELDRFPNIDSLRRTTVRSTDDLTLKTEKTLKLEPALVKSLYAVHAPQIHVPPLRAERLKPPPDREAMLARIAQMEQDIAVLRAEANGG